MIQNHKQEFNTCQKLCIMRLDMLYNLLLFRLCCFWSKNGNCSRCWLFVLKLRKYTMFCVKISYFRKQATNIKNISKHLIKILHPVLKFEYKVIQFEMNTLFWVSTSTTNPIDSNFVTIAHFSRENTGWLNSHLELCLFYFAW